MPLSSSDRNRPSVNILIFRLLKQSGYKLKNQFKNVNQPFSVVVSKGECTSIVLNKTNPVAQWPPAGIDIFKEK